jgi:hypothetical protein
MKRSRTIVTALLLAALFATAVPVVASAQTDGLYYTCEEYGKTIAKYEWDTDLEIYFFERDDGTHNAFIIEGDDTEGTWRVADTWGVSVGLIILKDGRLTTGPPTHSPEDFVYANIFPESGATSGTFSNDDFPEGFRDRGISYIEFCGRVTAIELVSFTAAGGVEEVNLAWQTGTETDNAGFNLYRSASADGPWTKVNGALIAAEGDPVAGASYSYVDTPGSGTFYYQLEDVDIHGVSTLHGPVKATVFAMVLLRPVHRPIFLGR